MPGIRASAVARERVAERRRTYDLLAEAARAAAGEVEWAVSSVSIVIAPVEPGRAPVVLTVDVPERGPGPESEAAPPRAGRSG